MPLTMRPASINAFCLSKVWFRCGSVNLRASDLKNITSRIKSWLFADQLEAPEEHILHRPREAGGLGLENVKYKAMSVLMKSFLETSTNPRYMSNQYHTAIFKHHIEGDKEMERPTNNPFIGEELLTNLKLLNEEQHVNLSSISSGQIYKKLVESHITMSTDLDGIRKYIPCRSERKNPQLDWENTWRLASLRGLDSENQSFLWRLLHDILPTQERLHRMNFRSAVSPHCIQCTEPVPVTDSVSHALLSCSQNREVSEWLISCLQQYCPALTHEQVVLLDFGTLSSNLEQPLVWLVAEVL